MRYSQEYWGELSALQKDTSNWPAGDKRAEAKKLLHLAKEEIMRAEAADENGRDVMQYIDRYNALIQKVFKL